MIDLVPAAAQVSVPTESWQAALREIQLKDLERLDRFRLVSRHGDLEVRLFCSWSPRKRGWRLTMDSVGRLREPLEGYSSRLAELGSAELYGRRTAITWVPLHGAIYVGKYYLTVEPVRRSDLSNQRLDPRAALIAELEALDRRYAAAPPAASPELALRYERDRRLTDLVRALRGERCQICGYSFELAGGGSYAECHHLEHLANGGLDVSRNILVLCANHHRQFHYGSVEVVTHTPDEIVLALDGREHTCRLSLT